MNSSKKCFICLNYVKSKKKVTVKHSLEDQMLITFFLRRLAWTPISDTEFNRFLRNNGSPSEWVALCHICEEQVLEAWNIHRHISKLIEDINEIRRKLYVDNFYETDDEDEDDDNDGNVIAGTESVFSSLRKNLASDVSRSTKCQVPFARTVYLKYNENNCGIPSEDGRGDRDNNLTIVNVKSEMVVGNDGQSNEDSMQEAVDHFFGDYVRSGSESQRSAPGLKTGGRTKNDATDGSKVSPSENPGLRDEVNLLITSAVTLAPRRGPGPLSKRRNVARTRNELIKTEKLPADVPHGQTVCPVCSKQFQAAGSMRRHYREHHLKIKRFSCQLCGVIFARREYLITHIDLKHPGASLADVAPQLADKQLSCTHCSAKFRHRRALRLHTIYAHSKARTSFACHACDKTFTNKVQLQRHKRMDHVQEVDISKRTCEICKKVFQQIVSLQRHIRESHEKSKDFICSECGQAFARKSYLRSHLLTQHTREEVTMNKIFTCSVCSTKCRGVDAFTTHMQQSHGDLLSVRCPLCRRTYTTPRALVIHMQFDHPEYNDKESSSTTTTHTHTIILERENESVEMETATSSCSPSSPGMIIPTMSAETGNDHVVLFEVPRLENVTQSQDEISEPTADGFLVVDESELSAVIEECIT